MRAAHQPGDRPWPTTPAAVAAALLLTALGFPGGGGAQQAAESGGAAFREEVSVGWVLVPFSVRGRRGFVDDLEPAEVRLYADGQPVTPDSFERGAEAAFELVLLQDLSGSMALGGRLEASRRAADCLLDGLRPGDRYAVASFAGRRITVEVPFTTDPQPGLEAVAAWDPYGVTALHDAVARLPEIRATGRAAGAAVLITDGAENASSLDSDEARDIVQRARLPVYVLSLARAQPRSPEDAESYADVLRRLAGATAGRYLPAATAGDLAEACQTIIQELRTRYVMGFPTAGGEARWRNLRVEVRRRGLQIRARAGYYGPPPAVVRQSVSGRNHR